MKFILVFSAFIATACVTDVKFEGPQPENVSDEMLIPNAAWGVYRSVQDSSLLFISATEMVRFVNKTFKVPRALLDSAYQFKGDTVFYDEENRLDVELIGDSVYGRFHRADTIFSISPRNVLRKFKGYYFLNKQTRNGWEVYLMTAKNNELSLVTSWREEDLAALRKITHSNDSTHRFKPSRSQIRKFILQHGLPAGEKFHRITDDDLPRAITKRLLVSLE